MSSYYSLPPWIAIEFLTDVISRYNNFVKSEEEKIDIKLPGSSIDDKMSAKIATCYKETNSYNRELYRIYLEVSRGVPANISRAAFETLIVDISIREKYAPFEINEPDYNKDIIYKNIYAGSIWDLYCISPKSNAILRGCIQFGEFFRITNFSIATDSATDGSNIYNEYIGVYGHYEDILNGAYLKVELWPKKKGVSPNKINFVAYTGNSYIIEEKIENKKVVYSLRDQATLDFILGHYQFTSKQKVFTNTIFLKKSLKINEPLFIEKDSLEFKSLNEELSTNAINILKYLLTPQETITLSNFRYWNSMIEKFEKTMPERKQIQYKPPDSEKRQE